MQGHLERVFRLSLPLPEHMRVTPGDTTRERIGQVCLSLIYPSHHHSPICGLKEQHRGRRSNTTLLFLLFFYSEFYNILQQGLESQTYQERIIHPHNHAVYPVSVFINVQDCVSVGGKHQFCISCTLLYHVNGFTVK